MGFMKLIGNILPVCFHPSCASKAFGGNGEVLSTETESEQRLVGRLVQQLRAHDGDFWTGLRRSQEHRDSVTDCPSQYHWLDNSQATFRNWMVTEPSCSLDQCVALFYRTVSANQRESDLFKWTDYSCHSRNNFICKYSDVKHLVSTPADNVTKNTDDLTVIPKHPPITMDNDKKNRELSESAVSLSDDTVNVYYVLLGTLPVILLLILLVSGVLCIRVMTRRRKEQNEIYAVPGQCVHTVPPKSHDYKCAGKFKQPGAHLEYMISEINRPFIVAPADSQFEGYENVQSTTQCGFVTNDIYEACRSSSALEAGWVDNDIYGC